MPAYREALLERFENPRIRHNLAQIAVDGSAKQQMRAVPVLKAERAAGRPGTAAARSIAAWIAYLDGRTEIADAAEQRVREANERSGTERVRALIAVLDEDFAAEQDVVEQISGLLTELA